MRPGARRGGGSYGIILGPPKHVLDLVCIVLGISRAIKTALKVAFYDFFDGPPAPLNSQFMEKVNHYNWTKQINFSMGPSVKFVLAIIDSISEKKKMGVNFFRKIGHEGGECFGHIYSY